MRIVPQQVSEGLFGPIDDSMRTTPWLLTPYSKHEWKLQSVDASEPIILGFIYPLGVAECLTTSTSLYRTVKEYAYWVRESEHSKMSNPTLVPNVRRLLHICSAMTNRQIWDFADVSVHHLRSIMRDCVHGGDRLIRASNRLEEGLFQFDHLDDLPRQLLLTEQYLNRLSVLKYLNIPDVMQFHPSISKVFNDFCRRVGLDVRYQSEKIADQSITFSTYKSYEAVINSVYGLRLRMEANSFAFNPKIARDAGYAKKNTKQVQSTPIPPPRLVFYLASKAADWIFTEAPRLFKTYENTFLCVPTHRRSLSQIGRAYDDLKDLFAACFFIIATFTARRPEEVRLLKQGCLRKDRSGQWWIEVALIKPKKRTVLLPVPPIVEAAVRVLEMFQARNPEPNSSVLFTYYDARAGVNRTINPANHLRNFAARVETPLYRDAKGVQTVWHWQARQCRRFTSVFYFYRFHGSMESLSTLLGHHDLRSARAYTKLDPAVAGLWHETEWEYVSEIVRGIAAGTKEFGGAATVHIQELSKRLLDLFRRRAVVAHPDDIVRATVKILQRSGVVVAVNQWATCLCPGTEAGAAKANCRRQGGDSDTIPLGADLSKASPSICNKCRWACFDGPARKFMDHTIEGLEGKLVSDDQSVLGMLQRERLIDLVNYRPVLEARADQGIRI
jgi:hypothetical protein